MPATHCSARHPPLSRLRASPEILILAKKLVEPSARAERIIKNSKKPPRDAMCCIARVETQTECGDLVRVRGQEKCRENMVVRGETRLSHRTDPAERGSPVNPASATFWPSCPRWSGNAHTTAKGSRHVRPFARELVLLTLLGCLLCKMRNGLHPASHLVFVCRPPCAVRLTLIVSHRARMTMTYALHCARVIDNAGIHLLLPVQRHRGRHRGPRRRFGVFSP
jgi:hypothetical protein